MGDEVALTFTDPEVVGRVLVPLISIEPGVKKLSLVPDETLASTEPLLLSDRYGGMGGHGRTYSCIVYVELLLVRVVGGSAALEAIAIALLLE